MRSMGCLLCIFAVFGTMGSESIPAQEDPGFTPESNNVSPSLEEASRISGVALAERRTLPHEHSVKKTDGAANTYFMWILRHRQEIVELMERQKSVNDELQTAVAEDAEEDVMADLFLQHMALQDQMDRYGQALGRSLRYRQEGFRGIAEKPNDWDGEVCNLHQECRRIDPITALFLLTQKQNRIDEIVEPADAAESFGI